MKLSLSLWSAMLLPCAAFCALFYSFFVASNNIGVQEEELTDFIAAVAMNNSDLLYPSIRVLGKLIPIADTPYQGPMKTWIVAPWLRIFGSSVYSARFMNVVFAMVYLLCLFWALKAEVGNRLSLLVFLVPFLDTKFLLVAPFDFGPFLFQVIFIALSLGGIFRFGRTENVKWFYFSSLMIGAVLAQKITALPVFAALYLVNIHYFLKVNKYKILNTHTIRGLCLSSILVLLPFSPHLLYFYKNGTGDFFAMSASPHQVNFITYWPMLWSNFTVFISSFDGIFWATMVTISPEVSSVSTIFGYLSLLLIVLAVSLQRYGAKRSNRLMSALVLFSLGLVLFSMIRGLNRPWHYFVLHPLWMTLCVISFSRIVDLLKRRRAFMIAAVTLFVVCPVILMSVNGVSLVKQIGTKQGAVLSSLAMHEVAEKLDALGAKEVYGLNFSIAAPLYYLSNGKIKTVKLEAVALDQERLNTYIVEVKRRQSAYLVARYCDNYYWNKDWIAWVNRDAELKELINNPGKYGLQSVEIQDKRGTRFLIMR